MNTDPRKAEKEEFVSGLNGTTFWEVGAIIHYSGILCGIRAVLLAILPAVILRTKWTRFVLEYCVLILPIIAITTILSEEVTAVFTTTVISLGFALVMLPAKQSLEEKKVKNAVELKRSAAEELLNANYDLSDEDSDILKQDADENYSFLTKPILAPNRVPVVTILRAFTTVISCVCILAVDFRVFSRRLAKTELFGTGLMDTGVGLFIVSNGLVSPEARGKYQCHRSFCKKLTHTRMAILSTWPLWSIGICRIFVLKFIGYQEHVSEYGVHWNFFFSLAAVRIFSAFLLSFFNISHTMFLSVVCILAYQFLLLHPSYDLSSVILNTDRDGFFMANKEGICSSAGYLSIYFASVYVGAYLFKGGRSNAISWAKVCLKFVLASIILWIITVVADIYIQPISRRFANLGFVSWILAMSMSAMAGMLLLDLLLIFCVHHKKLPVNAIPEQIMLKKNPKSKKNELKYSPPPPPLCLLAAVNRNQFVYFMLSNVSTGLVNLAFYTLNTPDMQAFIIVSFYMFFNLLFVWILHMKQISLKFW